jgi:hypothetical protein
LTSNYLPAPVFPSKINRISFGAPDGTENELLDLAMIKRSIYQDKNDVII